MDAHSFALGSLLPLGVAAAGGLLLGMERELAHKPAGLRTRFLVAVATAIFVLAGKNLGGENTGKIAANVLTGLGFLGAGVILEHPGNVRGLTTAALIWTNGALSLAAALGEYSLAVSGAVLAVAALRILGAMEKRMATRCGVMRYAVTASDGEELARMVHRALDRCHFQEGPLVFDRKGDTTAMQFAFCSPQARHREFAAALQQLPSVLDVRVD